MSWKIYTPEAFPAPGLQPEYLSAFGWQAPPCEAHSWVDIPDMHVEDRWTDWQHAAETDNPKQTPVKGRMIALRIHHNYTAVDHPWGGRGIMAADYDAISKEEREKIVAQSEAMNKTFRKNVINAFEIQYRAKMRGEPGRLSPTPYESQCYEILELNPPDLTKEANPTPQNVNIVMPNLQELIDAAVARALESHTAPAEKH